MVTSSTTVQQQAHSPADNRQNNSVSVTPVANNTQRQFTVLSPDTTTFTTIHQTLNVP